MKILHLSRMDSEGTGNAVIRLHQGLKQIGVSSKMLVLKRDSSDDDIIQLEEQKAPIRTLQDKLLGRMIYWELNNFFKYQKREAGSFSNCRSICDVSTHPLVQEADIIHLHWTAEMIDAETFFQKTAGKAIVLTLHDMNHFTGGCHYAGNCKKYEASCGACPQLNSNSPTDASHKIWGRKQRAYLDRKMAVVANSEWMSEVSRKSSLLRNFQIKTIHYGLPTNVFVKRDQKFSRNLLILPQNKTNILFGVAYQSKRKGLNYLLEALRLLSRKVRPANLALVTFGPTQPLNDFTAQTGISVHQLGFIRDEALLSHVYSAADICVIPSLEEAFGQVCLESMSCGTPVVGFATGGISDMLLHQKTGLLADSGNIESLSQQIEYMVTHPEERQRMANEARERVIRNHDLVRQAEVYFELYQELINKLPIIANDVNLVAT